MRIVYKVNSTGNTSKICITDDVNKLIDASFTVNILDVAFVLLDEAVEGLGVQPDCVINVSTVFIRVTSVELSGGVVQNFLKVFPPSTHGLASLHYLFIVCIVCMNEGQVTLQCL